MGMFDYVHFEMDCPTCGAPVKDFQTKDMGCDLITIEPDSLQNFYAPCRTCDTWIEFSRQCPQTKRDKSLTLDEVRSMGFKMDVTLGEE